MSRLSRLLLLLALGWLAWHTLLSPARRRQMHGYVTLLAWALMASSLASVVWWWWDGRR